jgi:inner membrane protein
MKLGLKLLVIGLVMVLLLVPILLLKGLVWERQQRAEEVRTEVAQSSSRAQRLLGPLLLVEIETEKDERRMVLENGTTREITEIKAVREQRLLLPASLALTGDFKTELRGRALFSAVLYHASFKGSAEFDLTTLLGPRQSLRRADLVMGLGDNRGIKQVELRAGGVALPIEPGARLPWLSNGLQAAIEPTALHGKALSIELDLLLTGTEALDFVPVGADTRIALSGDWPHPSFRGDLLPGAPQISAQGFSADWSVSRLASQAQQTIMQCGVEGTSCHGVDAVSFGLRLVDPVDRYLMTDRAMKYALLVLVLVFGAVFFMEVVGKGELHPLHYGLTGLALAMFFLLLLALAEHIGFGLAYLLAALACVALISSYLGGVLDSRRSTLTSALLLSVLYALLYGLLKAEDHALLLGALALFGCLSVFMLATRKVRWSGFALDAR